MIWVVIGHAEEGKKADREKSCLFGPRITLFLDYSVQFNRSNYKLVEE